MVEHGHRAQVTSAPALLHFEFDGNAASVPVNWVQS